MKFVNFIKFSKINFYKNLQTPEVVSDKKREDDRTAIKVSFLFLWAIKLGKSQPKTFPSLQGEINLTITRAALHGNGVRVAAI